MSNSYPILSLPMTNLSLFADSYNTTVSNIGDLAGLTTINTDSIVDAINELKGDFNDFIESSYGPITNEYWIVGVNAANSGNINLFKVNSSDKLVFGTSILPEVNNTHSLGSSTLKFLNTYTTTLYSDTIKSTNDLLISSSSTANTSNIKLYGIDSGTTEAIRGKTVIESGLHANSSIDFNTLTNTAPINIKSDGTVKVAFVGTAKNYTFYQDHTILSDGDDKILKLLSGSTDSNGAGLILYGDSVNDTGVSAKLITKDGQINFESSGNIVPVQTSNLGSSSKPFGEIVSNLVTDINDIGKISMWPTNIAPARHHFCNGASLLTADYPLLFAKIGYTFGGAGANFNLPNSTGRSPIDINASIPAINALGKTAGVWDHTHTIPTHYHGKGDINITSSGTHTTALDHDHGSVSTSADGTHTHNVTGTTGQDIAWYESGTGNRTAPVLSGNTFGGGTAQALANGNHTHIVDLPNFTGNSSSTGSHIHSNASFSGRVGNIAGVDGDSAMTSGANNHPVFVIRFIIRSS